MWYESIADPPVSSPVKATQSTTISIREVAESRKGAAG